MRQPVGRGKAKLLAPERLYSACLVGMLCLGLIGYAMFASARIVPAVRTWHALTEEVESARHALGEARGAQAQSPETLRKQVTSAESRLRDAAAILLPEAEAADVVARLQRCATESGVTLTALQGQPARREAGPATYDLRTFRVQATGPLVELEDFVSRVGAISPHGLLISNLSIVEGKQGHTLTMDLTMYASPYAEGGLLPTGSLLPGPSPAGGTTAANLSALDAAWAAGDWPRAIALIERILAAEPAARAMLDKLYAAYVNYGHRLLQEGNAAAAIAQLTFALEIRPEGPEALYYLQQASAALSPAPARDTVRYLVSPGDTLSGIAERYGTTVEAIMAANGLQTDDIYAGQELIVPTG